jgi:hypothetical protein
MPAEFDHSSDESTPTCSKDMPPHFRNDSTLVLNPHDINEELEDVKEPVEDIPDKQFQDWELPRHFVSHDKAIPCG